MIGSRSDQALLLVNTVSRRSSRKGIQPTWLSEKAIFSRGKRRSAPESSQSAMDMYAFSEVRAVTTPAGASGLVLCILEPDPMCMQITVPVSSQALKSGSQKRSLSWMEGRPRFDGSSVKAMAWKPRAALRRTSAAASVGSHSGTRPSGIRRPPLWPHHSSLIQSLKARTHARARSLSLASRKTWPAKRGKDGKHMERSVRLRSMSARRATGS